MINPNVDPEEIKKFDAMAKRWWDPEGDMKPLHLLNPLRLAYIQSNISLNNKRVLDVGCGGGILTESLAKQGAHVTGIDLSDAALDAAHQHLSQTTLHIDYKKIAVEDLAKQGTQFDIITCLEMLEHVPNPASIIEACFSCLKPGGSIFFSTINRTPKAFLSAIVGAEYLLKMLPKGTHHYEKFIKPSELNAWCQKAKLYFKHIQGISYHPLSGQFALSQNVDINYLVYYQRNPEDDQ